MNPDNSRASLDAIRHAGVALDQSHESSYRKSWVRFNGLRSGVTTSSLLQTLPAWTACVGPQDLLRMLDGAEILLRAGNYLAQVGNQPVRNSQGSTPTGRSSRTSPA